MADESSTVEIIVALILLIGSFMYVYNFFMGKGLLDMIIAIIIFAGSAVWLFSNVGKKK